MATDIKSWCRKIYAETIAAADINPDLKRALKTHERVPTFIDNLAREFSKLQHNVKRETIEIAIRDMTFYYIRCVETQSSERIMSDIAKMMLKRESEVKERLNAEIDAMTEGTPDHVTKNEKGETSRQVIEIK